MGAKMEQKKKFLPFLRGIFRNVRCRKSLCSKGTVGTGRGCCWFDTTRNAREARAPPRMSRDWLPTDAGRRLWIGAVGGSSRWNGEGRGEGKARSVDLRGVTGWEMPAGPHGHWEQMGIHPAGIYTGWVVSMREEKLKKSFLQFFFSFFYRRVVVECCWVGCFASWTCRGRWEFNFDRVRRGGRNVFYVQR